MELRTRDGRCIVVDARKVFALWANPELGTLEIASRLGLTKSQIWCVSRRLRLPPRPRAEMERLSAPSPEEIADRCAQVRAGWSDEEREKRIVGPRRRQWSMPAYAYDGRAVAFQATEHEF
jgi:hypothetical protein